MTNLLVRRDDERAAARRCSQCRGADLARGIAAPADSSASDVSAAAWAWPAAIAATPARPAIARRSATGRRPRRSRAAPARSSPMRTRHRSLPSASEKYMPAATCRARAPAAPPAAASSRRRALARPSWPWLLLPQASTSPRGRQRQRVTRAGRAPRRPRASSAHRRRRVACCADARRRAGPRHCSPTRTRRCRA